MPEQVVKSLEATVESGGVDVLVEIVEGEGWVAAHLSTTAEDDTLDLSRKDVRALHTLTGQMLDAMSTAPTPDPVYDALRLLAVSTFGAEDLIMEAEEGTNTDIDFTDLFDRKLLHSYPIADTGEYDTAMTKEGYEYMKQVLVDVMKGRA